MQGLGLRLTNVALECFAAEADAAQTKAAQIAARATANGAAIAHTHDVLALAFLRNH